MASADAPAEKPVVAFLGPRASFTHQAATTAFAAETHTLVPVATIQAVFEAVHSRAATLGVVPFENSTHGIVTPTLAALADRDRALAGLAVRAEIYLDVHHFLLGRQRRPAADKDDDDEPSPSLSHVRRVLSHPQALGQTRAFLARRLRSGVETVETSSTSRAAEMAAADASGATAAVAGEAAAREFGLHVLARCIEDRADNTTRFFVLGRSGDAGEVVVGGEQDGGGGGGGGAGGAGETLGCKSLVSFTVSSHHKEPGALAGVLDVFRRHGLNLTSINSLPSLVQPFQYLFFVEFEGSRLQDPEGRVGRALEEVAGVAEEWRWLGSWERQR